jgi:hypothetical protein
VSSLNIIRMKKSRRLKWVGHGPRKAKVRNGCRTVPRNEGKRHLGRHEYKDRTILK